MNGFFPRDFFHRVVLAITLFPGLAVHGRIYTITDTNDTTGVTSLRGAIMDANRRGGNNLIYLGREMRNGPGDQPQFQGIYPLTIAGADEDAAQTGDLDITNGNLTIIGAGSNVTIDATSLGDRVFEILPQARLSLKSITIIGGNAPAGTNSQVVFGAGGSGEGGGGILNAGHLALEHCALSGNFCGMGGDGLLNVSGNGGNGGGLCNLGVAMLDDCLISENCSGAAATVYGNGGHGGGIYNVGAMTLNHCVVVNNSAGTGGYFDGTNGLGGNGGGIYNIGRLTLNICTISSNGCGAGGIGTIVSHGLPLDGPLVCPGGTGGMGGGIFNASSLSLDDCTINSNSGGEGGAGLGDGGNGGAGGDGGGIYNTGQLTLHTCSISGNICGMGGIAGSSRSGTGGPGGNGGGIYSINRLILLSCTIANNSSGAGGSGADSLVAGQAGGDGGPGGNGGGIFGALIGFHPRLGNNLIAMNFSGIGGVGGAGGPGAGGCNPPEPGCPLPIDPGLQGLSGADGSSPDLAGYFISLGYNLIGVSDGSAGLVNAVNADLVGNSVSPIDPLIGPLQMNGGPTPTHALSPNSPALDKGNSFRLRRDQRGHRRPHNYHPGNTTGDGSDIGAFELDAPLAFFPSD